jgi:hypothetical protein
MYAARLIMFSLLSLSIGISCQAATFEKVSSSFSFDYDLSLDCSGSDPGDRKWQMIFTDVTNDPGSFSHTPILKKGGLYLVSLDHLQWAESILYYDGPGGGGGSASTRVALDANDPYHNRVLTSARQRPVLTFWQPGFDHTYSVTLTAATQATTYYKISPLAGENIGDEMTLTAEGWTEHEENSNGPSAFPGTNNVSSPGYRNLSDGTWHTVDGTRSFTARIGDTVGMRTSVSSAMNSAGTIGGWGGREYMPCGLFASSSISLSLPLYVKKLPGDLNADDTVNLADAVLGLQFVSGLAPAGIRSGTGADVNGDKRIGLEEVIYVVQIVAGLRQN